MRFLRKVNEFIDNSVEVDNVEKDWSDISNIKSDEMDILKNFKSEYTKQLNLFVNIDGYKISKTQLNLIWREIFKFTKNINNINLYKRKGKPDTGMNRSERGGTISDIISSLISLLERYLFDGKYKNILNQLRNVNKHLAKINKSDSYFINKLRDDLWEIFKEEDTNKNALNVLNRTLPRFLMYENSFTDKGFSKPVDRRGEGRIHNLKGGEFMRMLISDKSTDDIFNYVKDNITNYVVSVGNIDKYDIISNNDINSDSGDLIIKNGSKIEVKKMKYKNFNDGYYSEPLASPVKIKDSPIVKSPELLERYTQVISKLYDWLSGSGKNISEQIISKMVNGTSGIFLDNYIYIPIDGVEFYLSDKGHGSNKRLSIRYRIKDNANVYKLNGDILEEIESITNNRNIPHISF